MFVFVSDTHLYPYTWGALQHSMRGDSYDAFAQVIEYCAREKPQALILGGDVFDAAPTPDAVRVFLDGMARLKQCNIPVLAIQGQHGRYREFSWTSIDAGVADLEKEGPRTIDGITIAGFDNRAPEELREKLLALHAAPPQVLVLHQLAKGTVPDIDGQQWDLDPDWVPSGVRLVLLGDYHVPWQLDRANPDGTRTLFVYNGATCMRSVNEVVEKSFMTVDVPTQTFTRVPLRTRPFQRYKVETEAERDELFEAVKKLEKGTLVSVAYAASVPDVETGLRKANKHIHLLCRPVVGRTLDTALPALPADDGEPSLEACLAQLIKRDEQPEVFSLTLELLRTDAVVETLDKWRTRIMAQSLPVEQADQPSKESA